MDKRFLAIARVTGSIGKLLAAGLNAEHMCSALNVNIFHRGFPELPLLQIKGLVVENEQCKAVGWG